MKCKLCGHSCQKAGKRKNGTQKLYCKDCNKYQQSVCRSDAYLKGTKQMTSKLICEGVSVRGIARILQISINTVQAYVKWRGKQTIKPPIPLNQANIEIDDLHTFVGHKQNPYWIAYGLNRATGKVLDFVIGKRSTRTLSILVNTLLVSGPHKINTDRLKIYQALVPSVMHEYRRYCTNWIERKNLSIRTHIKRLSRRTICFSRSLALLESCLKIYFWGTETPIPWTLLRER